MGYSKALSLMAACLLVGSAPLKVKSISKDLQVFSGSDRVVIQWTVDDFDKPLSYCVQRSKNNIDFEELSCSKDNAVIPELKHFLETDFDPIPGWSYYKINLLNAEGQVVESKTAPVFFGMNRLVKGKLIAPDPLNKDGLQKLDPLKLEGKSFLFVIKSGDGQEFHLKSEIKVNDTHFELSSNRIKSGVYNVLACSNYSLVGLDLEVNGL